MRRVALLLAVFWAAVVGGVLALDGCGKRRDKPKPRVSLVAPGVNPKCQVGGAPGKCAPAAVKAELVTPKATAPAAPVVAAKAEVKVLKPHARVVKAHTARHHKVGHKKHRKHKPEVVVAHKVVDLSNNDPANFGQFKAMKRHGVEAVILKVNQGLGFRDRTFANQVRYARAVGMAVCGYDFVSTYSAQEARFFVNLLHASGIRRNTPNTCPPDLDIEYGNAFRGGIDRMVSVVRSEFGRVQAYTGNWYWSRLGCYWPQGVVGWLSGYPRAPIPCGLPHPLYLLHQYTDKGFNGAFPSDVSVWLGSQSQWLTYINAEQKAVHPTGRAFQARLRILLRRHHCHRGSGYPACRAWLQEKR